MDTTHTVVTSSGTHSSFQRDVLLFSVYESLKHRKSAPADATALTDTIIELLYLDKKAIIQTATITAVAIKTLANYDQLAADLYKVNREN